MVWSNFKDYFVGLIFSIKISAYHEFQFLECNGKLKWDEIYSKPRPIWDQWVTYMYGLLTQMFSAEKNMKEMYFIGFNC
jgi:hypothetical protein